MKKFAIVLLSLAAAACGFLSLACGGGETKAQLEFIELSDSAKALKAEETFVLSVSQFPAEAEPAEIEWFSSDEEVVCVEDGKVTAKARGTATVTARTRTGNFSAKCDVSVSDTDTFKTVYPGESINAAVASVPENNGRTVTVKLMSGTYVEDVVLNRPNLRLAGANAGLDCADLPRKAESVIQPATSKMPSSALNEDRQNLGVISVDADNVTIDGVAVDGDNPALETPLTAFSGSYQTGGQTDAYTGIVVRVKKLSYSEEFPVMHKNLSVKNCDIRNVFYAGVSLSAKNSLSVSEGNEILYNRICNVLSTTYGYGVELDKNVCAEISGNRMENVETGVQLNVLNVDSGSQGCICKNEIDARTNGVVLAKISADCGYDVKDNVIRSQAGNFGVAYLTCTKDTFRNLFASGNRIEGFAYGVHVFNSNRAISVLGGEITDCENGLYVSDTSATGLAGMSMTLVDVINVNCEDTTFADCGNAVHVFSDKRRNNSMVLSGGVIRNCDTGLRAEVGSGASAIINVAADPAYDNVGAEEVAVGAGKINRAA